MSQTSQVISSKPSLGPIIGGVLGALALLTIAFIAFMFFRRKNKDHLHHQESNNFGTLETENEWWRLWCVDLRKEVLPSWWHVWGWVSHLDIRKIIATQYQTERPCSQYVAPFERFPITPWPWKRRHRFQKRPTDVDWWVDKYNLNEPWVVALAKNCGGAIFSNLVSSDALSKATDNSEIILTYEKEITHRPADATEFRWGNFAVELIRSSKIILRCWLSACAREKKESCTVIITSDQKFFAVR